MNRLALFIVALVLVGPASAVAQKDKKPAKDDTPRATAQEYGQLNQMKEILGKLTAVDANVKTIVLRVETQQYEPNPNFKPPKGTGANLVQANQRLLADYQRALNISNPTHRAQALERVSREMQQLSQKMYQQQAKAQADLLKNPQNLPFKVVTTARDFELEVQDKVVTRRLNLAVEYDGKGYLKQYSKEELAELRGKDTSKPGFAAKYEDLAVGQQVKLYLVAAKPPAKEESKAKKDDKEKKDDADLSSDPPLRPSVRMVLITEDAPVSSTTPAKEKKKKT